MSKEIVHDFIAYLPARIIPAVVGVISIPVLTHLLSPGDYGQYVLAYTSIYLISSLCLTWLVSITIRFFPVYGGYRLIKNSLRLLIYSLILASLLWVTAAVVIGDEISSIYFIVSGLFWIVVYGAFEYFSGWLRVLGQPKYYGFAQSWRSIGGLTLAVILLGLGYIGGDVVIFSASIVMGAALIILPRHVMNSVGVAECSENSQKEDVSSLLKYGIPSAFANFLIIGLSIGDRYIVEIYHGVTVLAVYAASYDLIEKTIFFANSMLLLSSSVIGYRIFEKDGETRAVEFLYGLMRIYLIIALPFVSMLMMFSSEIFSLIFPEEYRQGSVIVPLVALGGVCVGIMHRYTLVLGFHKRTDLIMWCSAGALVVNIALGLLLIPSMSIVGAGLGTLLGYASWLILVRLSVRKYKCPRFPWMTFMRVMMSILITIGTISLVKYFYSISDPFLLMLTLVLGLSLYIVCLVFVGEVTRNDISSFKDILNRKIKKV